LTVLDAQPLIHLAYALELSSPTLAIEALTMACCLLDTEDKYMTESKSNSRKGTFSAASPITVFNEIAHDSRLNGITPSSSGGGLELSKEHEQVVLEYWNALEIDNLTSQFEEMQRLAVALAISVRKSVKQPSALTKNLLHSSRAVRVLLPLIPPKYCVPLIRQWWLLVITTYVCNGRVESATQQIARVDADGMDWGTVEARSQRNGLHDAYFIAEIVAIRQMAETWGDPDRYYLKAALLYGEE
jgi:Questin oxidase-like